MWKLSLAALLVCSALLVGCSGEEKVPEGESMAGVLKDIDTKGTSKSDGLKKVDPTKEAPTGG